MMDEDRMRRGQQLIFTGCRRFEFFSMVWLGCLVDRKGIRPIKHLCCLSPTVMCSGAWHI